ncbi:MAG TPA: hypothetical protein VHI98_19165 [Vicinamibacterales bacterium]|nr:hypothetical protein [Vicinamibacterales bacterium]
MLLALGLVVTIFGIATIYVGMLIVKELRRSREEATTMALLALFVPAVREAREDPKRLLAWEPAVAVARRLFGPAMARLDGAGRGGYPFTEADVREAHARWTTAWLAWERAHDEECRLKAVAAEMRGGAEGRAELAALERDKLQRYQQRYEEYVRVGKALKALFEPDA